MVYAIHYFTAHRTNNHLWEDAIDSFVKLIHVGTLIFKYLMMNMIREAVMTNKYDLRSKFFKFDVIKDNLLSLDEYICYHSVMTM